MAPDRSAAGERELAPREPGVLFGWVKSVSVVELAVFAGLLVVWLAPGLERPTFWFGLSHGIGFLLLCALIWVAVLRREAPFWLLAATLTPLGPIGSTIGVLAIERREARGAGDAAPEDSALDHRPVGAERPKVALGVADREVP